MLSLYAGNGPDDAVPVAAVSGDPTTVDAVFANPVPYPQPDMATAIRSQIQDLIPEEEVLGPVETGVVIVNVFNGYRICISAFGDGFANQLAQTAGELLNQHLHSPEAPVPVQPNTLAV